MNNNDFTSIQQSLRQFASTIQRNENNEMADFDRTQALILLTDLLNSSNVGISERHVIPGQFRQDGQMHIECGEKDKYGNCKWEIVLWLDGVVQATTYDLNLGGLYDYGRGRSLNEIIENPQLAMDDLNDLIENYNRDVEEMIEDGSYDFEIND